MMKKPVRRATLERTYSTTLGWFPRRGLRQGCSQEELKGKQSSLSILSNAKFAVFRIQQNKSTWPCWVIYCNTSELAKGAFVTPTKWPVSFSSLWGARSANTEKSPKISMLVQALQCILQRAGRTHRPDSILSWIFLHFGYGVKLAVRSKCYLI